MDSLRLTMLFALILCTGISTSAQDITWSEDVAPLLYSNCSPCHHDGGIAPFSIMSYEDATTYAMGIHHQISEGTMPPWPADPNYMHFANETYLEPEEAQAILDWLSFGMAPGNLDNAPAPPVFLPSGSLLDQIDLTLEIPAYTLQSNGDEYRWFVIENTESATFYINKLEVLPGLDNVVHHVDLFLDYSGVSLSNDLADPLPGFNNSTGSPVNNFYVNAWQPGAQPAEYPPGWGIEVLPGADLVIEIHYGPGGFGDTDDTKMNLQFTQVTENVRQVNAQWLLGQSPPVFIDGPLVIPANETATFHQVSQPLTQDLSIISICPHMHQLGRSYEVWYEDPDGVEHPLIYIPNWDFHWQKYYTFQQVLHIPAGSIIKSEAVYDNTSANHDNPFDPPQTVTAGSTTLDEMFLCYFIYAYYQAGDENIIMDSTIIDMPTSIKEVETEPLLLYPNPTNGPLHLVLPAARSNGLELIITDIAGRSSVAADWMGTGENDPVHIDVSHLSPGEYLIRWESGEHTGVERFSKR